MEWIPHLLNGLENAAWTGFAFAAGYVAGCRRFAHGTLLD